MAEGDYDHGGTFRDKSFVGALWEKLMDTRVAAKKSGKNFDAAEKETLRQIRQVTQSGANPDTGIGVTKSGIED